MPEEWLPTNRQRAGQKHPLGCLYFYQKRPMRRDELQAIKRDFPPFDSNPKRTYSASAENYAAANMVGSPDNRPPSRPPYNPASIPQVLPAQQQSYRPQPRPQQPQPYAYAAPLPSGGRPSPMQPIQQRPQRPPYQGRLSTSSLSESDYESYDSYDDRPPEPSHSHRKLKKKPLSVAGKINKAYEEEVLERIGGAADAVERFLTGSPKKKSSSSHRPRPPRHDSCSDTSSSSYDTDEDYDRRRRRSIAPRQDLRRSSLANNQRTRLNRDMPPRFLDNNRHSVCV